MMRDNYFKYFRKRAGFSQQELVSRLSVGLSTYKQWEWGQGTPTIDQLREIDAVLNERNVRLPIVEVIDKMMSDGLEVTEAGVAFSLDKHVKPEVTSNLLPPVDLYEHYQSYGGKPPWIDVADEKKLKLDSLYKKCLTREKHLKTYYEAEFFKILTLDNYNPVDEPPF